MAIFKLDSLAWSADHSKHPHHHGRLKMLIRSNSTIQSCGDVIRLSVKFDEERQGGRCCSCESRLNDSTASASMMTDAKWETKRSQRIQPGLFQRWSKGESDPPRGIGSRSLHLESQNSHNGLNVRPLLECS